MPELNDIVPKKKKPNYKVKYLFGFRGDNPKPISAYTADLAAGAACGLHCATCEGEFFHCQNCYGTHWLRHRDAHDPGEPGESDACMASTWDVLEQALCAMLVEYMRNEPDADDYDIFDVHDPEDSDMAYYLNGIPNYRTDILTVNLKTDALTFYEMVVTSKMSSEKRKWLIEEFDVPHPVWILEMWRSHDLIHSYLKDNMLDGESLTRIIDEEDLKKQVPTAYSVKEETAWAENERWDAEKKRRNAEMDTIFEKMENEYLERRIQVKAEHAAKLAAEQYLLDTPERERKAAAAEAERVAVNARLRAEAKLRQAVEVARLDRQKDVWPDGALVDGWDHVRDPEKTSLWRRYSFWGVPAFAQIPNYECEIALVLFEKTKGYGMVWVNAEDYLNSPASSVKFSKTYRTLGRLVNESHDFAKRCADGIPCI